MTGSYNYFRLCLRHGFENFNLINKLISHSSNPLKAVIIMKQYFLITDKSLMNCTSKLEIFPPVQFALYPEFQCFTVFVCICSLGLAVLDFMSRSSGWAR